MQEAALEVLEGMTPPSSLFAGGAGSEAERKKELKILYDSLLEPAFAIQADDVRPNALLNCGSCSHSLVADSL